MTQPSQIVLPEDRFFGPDVQQKKVALELFSEVEHLPIVCPHGHVDPGMFADEKYSFGTPTQLLIIPDHYVFRMLYSQGIGLEKLGIARLDAGAVDSDHRKIWQIFAENFHLFRGTPCGMWLTYELHFVFGIKERLTAESAQRIYDEISQKLSLAEFRPRKLFEQFNIEVLCTTDAATDTLQQHQKIRASGWKGRVLPTFRPDALTNLKTPGWNKHIEELGLLCGFQITSYKQFISALENRRAFFKQMGATSTDSGVAVPLTLELSESQAEAIFSRALAGRQSEEDAIQFSAHMLMEMARMSIEDGLVMQLHPGVYRNHNSELFARFGADKGADIPQAAEFTRNLHALLNKYGSDARLRLILFTLDETAYARELAPLAGHYPALRLGPPWWFCDSLNGMARYFDQVMETAGVYNTAGFNDDTRAFASIPARHDLWRRASVNWLSGLVVRNIIAMDEASEMARLMACDLARGAYNL